MASAKKISTRDILYCSKETLCTATNQIAAEVDVLGLSTGGAKVSYFIFVTEPRECESYTRYSSDGKDRTFYTFKCKRRKKKGEPGVYIDRRTRGSASIASVARTLEELKNSDDKVITLTVHLEFSNAGSTVDADMVRGLPVQAEVYVRGNNDPVFKGKAEDIPATMRLCKETVEFMTLSFDGGIFPARLCDDHD